MEDQTIDPTKTEGGSQEAPAVAGTPVPIVGRRAEAMEAVIARAKQEREDEISALSENLVPDDESVERQPERQDADGTTSGPAPLPEAGEPARETSREELVKIVVDGEERTVPLSQVRDAGIRTLQKLSAADKRLEDATRLLKEAEAAAAERRSGLPEQSDARDNGEPVDADAGGEDWEDLAYAIQMGDQQESAAALQKLIRKAQMPQQEISRIVEERLHSREIVSKFSSPVEKGGFSDLWEDPFLKQKADAEATRLLHEGSPNVWETYQTAGENVRAWLREKAGVPAGEVHKNVPPGGQRIVVSEQKKDKRTIDSLIGAGGKSETQTTPKPRSASEIVAEIKRMRGQS